ncbi:MAG TPA: FIST N-terminal domain-containing protein [Ktedonobacteraceae bacterium]|nr:FIST N-terminal domain-containing protein [Ktedonobacteraceae bacterium]
MDAWQPVARSTIVKDAHWERALEKALEQTTDIAADVALLFASGAYARYFPEILHRARHETGASVLIGCSGQGIIGTAQELEGVPALALLTLSLPGAILHSTRLTQEMVEDCSDPADWPLRLEIPSHDVNAWLIFADPYRLDCEELIEGLEAAYPGRPMLGGLASFGPTERRTFVFLNREVYDAGGVGLSIGGPYTIQPLVSQGCEPIGEPWTITAVQDNIIQTISNRPAYDLLVETLESLPEEMQLRAQNNLMVGLAADEYRESFGRGSYLIRPLLGIDPDSGAIAIGAYPRLGQTIQFQMRDATAADLDLKELLEKTRANLGAQKPFAGILCSCNGRGIGMFGEPHHDASAIANTLGMLPLAGLFCNGEIGPIGTRTFLHGFTASLALLMKKE